MSIDKVAAVYGAAFQKIAEDEIYERYSVNGYFPPGYAEAFMAKEAGEGGLISGGIKWLGHQASRGGAAMQRGVATELRGGLANPLHGSQLSSSVPTGMQKLRHATGSVLSSAGKTVQKNPLTAAALGTAGVGTVGAAGILAGRASKD